MKSILKEWFQQSNTKRITTLYLIISVISLFMRNTQGIYFLQRVLFEVNVVLPIVIATTVFHLIHFESAKTFNEKLSVYVIYIGSLMTFSFILTSAYGVLLRLPIDTLSLLSSYVVSSIALLALVLGSIAIAYRVKSNARVVVYVLGAYFIMSIISLVQAQIGSIFFTSYMGWFRMWTGSTSWFGLLVSGLILFGTIGLFYVLSLIGYHKYQA